MSYNPLIQSTSSTLNSTSAPLAGGATFTGTAELNSAQDVMVSCKTDADGILYAEFSIDNVNWDSSIPVTVNAGINEFHTYSKGSRYFRIRYVNGSAAQSYFRLGTYFGQYRQGTSGLSSSVQQDADAITARTISEETFTSEGKYTGRSIVHKFGRNPDVDAAEDIWNGGGTYTGFPVSGSAETLSVFSSSANDTAAGTGARTVILYGLDSSYNEINETVTLNGTTPVATTNTFWRMHLGIVVTAGSSEVNEGSITARHSTTTANVFMVMPIGYSFAAICCYTIPAGYTGYIKKYRASMLDNTTNQALMAGWYRGFGEAAKTIRPFTINTTNGSMTEVYGAIPLPEKTDLKMRCMSVINANADITASFDIVLVKN